MGETNQSEDAANQEDEPFVMDERAAIEEEQDLRKRSP
jgi:hypothetical protein